MIIVNAEAPARFDWVDTVGEDAGQISISDLAVANNGDTISIGFFHGTVDFDSRPRNYLLDWHQENSYAQVRWRSISQPWAVL